MLLVVLSGWVALGLGGRRYVLQIVPHLGNQYAGVLLDNLMANTNTSEQTQSNRALTCTGTFYHRRQLHQARRITFPHQGLYRRPVTTRSEKADYPVAFVPI